MDANVNVVPSLTELKQEEAQAQMEEEADVALRREAAQKLAAERGLQTSDSSSVGHDLSLIHI